MIPAPSGHKSMQAIKWDVDQMTAEIKDTFGDGLVLKRAILLYEAVVEAIKEAEEEARLDEPVHTFELDRREFAAENPCVGVGGEGGY